MKHLFDSARLAEIQQRLEQLRPDSERLWGKMTPAQMLAHCNEAIRMAEGEGVSAANSDWTTAGADREEGGDRKRESNTPEFDDG